MEQEQVSKEQIATLEALKKDYISAFSGTSGKKVLEDLESKCFSNRTTFPADGNAQRLAFQEGMRYVVVHIKNMQTMNIEHLRKLIMKGANQNV